MKIEKQKGKDLIYGAPPTPIKIKKETEGLKRRVAC